MQRIARHDDFIALRHIHIREVGGKNEIVGLDSRAQQQGTSTPQGHHQFGKMASALIEDSLLTHSQRLDVTIAIEYGEHPAVLEHPRSIVGG